MKNEKEEWIEEVFGSLEGRQKAKPNKDLFAKIQAGVQAEKVKLIPVFRLKMMAVAAIVLLALNVNVIVKNTRTNNFLAEEMITNDASEVSLISDFNLYE